MNKLAQNVNFEELRETVEKEKKVYLPKATCPLLKHRPQFYTEYLQKVITLVPDKPTVDDTQRDFEVLVNVSSQVLCMINLKLYHKMAGSYDRFEKVSGFDMKFLPDDTYLLRLIASQSPSHRIVKNLPHKGTGLSHEWKNTVCKNALNNILSTGKVQQEHKVSLEDCKEFIEEMNESAKVYYMMKFKMKDMTNRMKAVMKLAKNNPTVQDLVHEYKPSDQLLKISAQLKNTQNEITLQKIADKRKESAEMVTE